LWSANGDQLGSHREGGEHPRSGTMYDDALDVHARLLFLVAWRVVFRVEVEDDRAAA
jgi:hypothetical protein